MALGRTGAPGSKWTTCFTGIHPISSSHVTLWAGLRAASRHPPPPKRSISPGLQPCSPQGGPQPSPCSLSAWRSSTMTAHTNRRSVNTRHLLEQWAQRGQCQPALAGSKSHCSPQAGLEQSTEGTHRSEEPVSKSTRNCWGGVPMEMAPTYSACHGGEGGFQGEQSY